MSFQLILGLIWLLMGILLQLFISIPKMRTVGLVVKAGIAISGVLAIISIAFIATAVSNPIIPSILIVLSWVMSTLLFFVIRHQGMIVWPILFGLLATVFAGLTVVFSHPIAEPQAQPQTSSKAPSKNSAKESTEKTKSSSSNSLTANSSSKQDVQGSAVFDKYYSDDAKNQSFAKRMYDHQVVDVKFSNLSDKKINVGGKPMVIGVFASGAQNMSNQLQYFNELANKKVNSKYQFLYVFPAQNETNDNLIKDYFKNAGIKELPDNIVAPLHNKAVNSNYNLTGYFTQILSVTEVPTVFATNAAGYIHFTIIGGYTSQQLQEVINQGTTD